MLESSKSVFTFENVHVIEGQHRHTTCKFLKAEANEESPRVEGKASDPVDKILEPKNGEHHPG